MKVEISKLVESEEYCRKVFNFFIKKGIIKKTNPTLFEKYLNKSLNNLEFGNFIFDEHKYSIKKKLKGKSFYDWVIIVYYYAIYHSVLALVRKSGFESKNHLASISALTYIYFYKKNILKIGDIQFIIENFDIKSSEIEFISGSKELREKASYRVDEDFNLLMAKSLQEKTAEFVNKTKDILIKLSEMKINEIREKVMKKKDGKNK